jgi:hypothetical protein
MPRLAAERVPQLGSGWRGNAEAETARVDSSMEQQCVELRPAVRVAAVGRVADD